MKRFFFILLIAILCCSFAAPALSYAAEAGSDVLEVDIGMRSGDYRRMVSSENEYRYPAFVSVDGGAYIRADIHIRGRTSKMMGLSMPSKRVPVALQFPSVKLFSNKLDNKTVKLINSYTPFRLLAEYLALEMYDFMDIPTPDHSFVFLCYNGVNDGLYLAVEDVNAAFIQKHFAYTRGSLYKETSTDSRIRAQRSVWFGPFYPKINHGTTRFKALLNALDRGEGYEEYLDMDEVLRFFACTAATGADVSILTELSGFLLYDNNGKFVLIPWDSSEAFQGYVTKNGIDRFYLEYGEDVLCPLFELIMKDPDNRARYHAYIKQIVDSFLAPERMHPYLQDLLTRLSPYLARDRSVYLNYKNAAEELFTDESSPFICLRYTLDRIYQSLNDQLAGRSDTFFFHEQYLTQEMPETPEEITAFFMRLSPMLDPDLPDKICGAYPEWKASMAGGVQKNTFADQILFFLILAGGALTVIGSFIVPKIRYHKKNRIPEGGERE